MYVYMNLHGYEYEAVSFRSLLQHAT